MNIKESDCEIKREAAQVFCTRQLDEAIKTITDESEPVGERFNFMCQHSKESQKRHYKYSRKKSL
ncbi:hypothetical protein [Vibrio sp. THAF190c]|uniref:hypothetical protein n=1 Tax=Vibrio sp. THAF190c TaxID=2587865 RepID=UPI001267B41F|nr:hypothetical protein [Vibrio sp. THAF190c]QFT10128.1 hypothetical protein FIV04_09095 [Vibrio sp. THAF190c]